MPVETLCRLFPELTALLIQAEHAPIAAERGEAIERLKSIRRELDLELHRAEARLRNGTGSKVEVSAVRSSATTLSDEITILEAAESLRLTRVRPILSPSRLMSVRPVVEPLAQPPVQL
jgi:hypothetical protein